MTNLKRLNLSSKKIDRVYFHYSELEEYHAGMWRIVRGEQRKQYVGLSAELMRDIRKFRSAMRRAIMEWPNSCASAFSSDSTNHLAFLGHAGCCIACGSPEEATRVAWHTLTMREQALANKAAADIVKEWHRLSRYQGELFDA